MQYTDELKADALLMMQQGTKIAEVSQLLNIPASTLYRWRSESRPDPKPQQAAGIRELQDKVAALEGQVAQLQGQLAEIGGWVSRKMRAEQKEREQRDCEQETKPRLVLGKR